jgi:hypothetical protein
VSLEIPGVEKVRLTTNIGNHSQKEKSGLAHDEGSFNLFKWHLECCIVLLKFAVELSKTGLSQA